MTNKKKRNGKKNRSLQKSSKMEETTQSIQQNRFQGQARRKGKIVKDVGITVGILGVIIAGVALIIQFFDIKLPLRSKPKVDIMEDSISIEYLKNLRDDDQEIYPLFIDKFDDTNSAVFNDNCATQLFVTNDYEEAITLDKIIFKAQDIEQNLEPTFIIRSRYLSTTESQLEIVNTGWSDAENVNISFDFVDADINKYLPVDKQTLNIPLIEFGEMTVVPLWNSYDFLLDGDFQILVNCNGNDGSAIETEYDFGDNGIYIRVENGLFPLLGGRGAPSQYIYGIEIDTSQKEFIVEKSISENINPHDRLELPICFSADKSCNLKFQIGFEAVIKNNKKIMIWSEPAYIDFKVSSIVSDSTNVENYSKDELLDIAASEPGSIKITYPYVDKETFMYVQSF